MVEKTRGGEFHVYYIQALLCVPLRVAHITKWLRGPCLAEPRRVRLQVTYPTTGSYRMVHVCLPFSSVPCASQDMTMTSSREFSCRLL